MFHSYVSKSVSILRDDSVQVDRSDPDVKSYHGVLIYGNNVTAPFIPKYLSICLETSTLLCVVVNRSAVFPIDVGSCGWNGPVKRERGFLLP